ncbi:pyrroloquinoline-quinone synthase PqqC [Mesorhizobium sp. B283B1A]|uniref:Pyrroloquinoline-quinone synthase n=1 Tax=Mesorhizobium opportunistum TaxID=593909 RepID=A0ABV1YQ95_9HYPH|nr:MULTISPECIES: pyrroloquinoline-quinone synthase PqqC [Mesorhizobium]MCA0049033.1 pyrroloquinoline-quinone synthase PqqC [Mesorhizobium sp. B283B1A]TIN91112.1 MAG: pyrroloquinoline-quinone synthase PqqC [Mesorhizobium sp.]TJU94565.1 MAG: pyrroloquinoline-quinone synthase PqqC [Mesorhizobium sp.]TJV13909.1 MAG: pyrroloquinoline-quinone synthase PqqC [Mesorhizobium sp.]TJV40163.1 MAG: pyrroloquinoline-quinone synthase PqqC [Mesorhizobium sp.]
MSHFRNATRGGLSKSELEAVLRQVGAERYHIHHPFHHRMTSGALSKWEMQAWALNRYCYQAVIPRKDAMILAHAEDPAFRAAWRKRIEDHDGEDGWSGGIARWLYLATSLGLDTETVRSERLALPATRFAVGAYLSFCTNRTLLEAVASSLTEMFSPTIIDERVSAMLARYDYITEDTVAYFSRRPEQASRDADFALAYVLDHADTAERQQQAIDALVFKCDILWAMLDALQHAYGEPGNLPPGAFRPGAAR